MKFKLIVAIVAEDKTDAIIETARKGGATGCTVITRVHGEGLRPPTTFLGLTLEGQRDVLWMLVEEHLSRQILESIAEAGQFDEQPGTGVAFQIDIEDVIGLRAQMKAIEEEIEDEI